MLRADHRTYIIVPDGNYFINPVKGQEYNDIHYGKTCGFLSLNKSLFNNKLKLGAIIRADKNDYFPLAWNPRFTAVYSPDNKNSFRVSFQSGYRFPSIFEAYSNINSGGVKLVGGLKIMSDGIFENAWLQTSITAFQSAVLNDINKNGFSKNAAIANNKGLLKKIHIPTLNPNTSTHLKPDTRAYLQMAEFIFTWIFIYNNYQSFIAQANMNVPKTQNADSFALNDKHYKANTVCGPIQKQRLITMGFLPGLNTVLAGVIPFMEMLLLRTAKINRRTWTGGWF